MIIALIIIIIVVGYAILNFNGLMSLRQQINASWSDVYVELKRRHDLIPNLVETVKAYSAHEEVIFDRIASLRTQAINANPDDAVLHSTLQTELGTGVRQLLAIGEAYPQLRASENFQKLQDELTKTEDEIASSRRIYNENVADFNAQILQFPKNLVAATFGIKTANYFQTGAEVEATPSVT